MTFLKLLSRHLSAVVCVFIWVYPWHLLLRVQKTGLHNTHVKPITLKIQMKCQQKANHNQTNNLLCDASSIPCLHSTFNMYLLFVLYCSFSYPLTFVKRDFIPPIGILVGCVLDKNVYGIKVNIISKFTFLLRIPALIVHNSLLYIISNTNLIKIIT